MTVLPRGKRMDRQRCKLPACPGIPGFWIPTASEMWLLPDVWESQVCVCAKSLQSCPTLCDPMDCGPPGSSVHGILQATILEWIAIPFSRGFWNFLDLESGESNGTPLQYSCLENPMDGGAWWATVHSVAKSRHD